MILPMKKITLVVLDGERESALKALRKVGVVHVERQCATGHTIDGLQALLGRLEQACSALSETKAAKGAKPAKYPGRERTIEVIDRVLSLKEEKRLALERIASVSRELDRLAPWGAVDPSDFDYLSERGVYLFPFEMSVGDYTHLPNSVRSIVVNRDNKTIRCVIWGESDLLHAEMPSGARELSLPDRSTAEMLEELNAAEKLVPEIDLQLGADAVYLDALSSLRKELKAELDFETIRAGMNRVELGAADKARDVALSAPAEALSAPPDLAWLVGYVPAEDESLVVAAVKKNGWALMSDDPAEEDNVPTKLRNNRVVGIITPLLDFLGTVPGYREIDISLWFLLFFGIFFAMIFGDAGYGALIVLMALGGMVSSARKGERPAVALFMIAYLGMMTVVWGTLTCTWFGIPYDAVPSILRSLELPAISNGNPDSTNNIKILCFTIGLVQISLAHVIGILRNRRSLKLLGELGALTLAIGMFFVVLNLVVDATKYPLTTPVLAMVIGGFALNFIFINYSGSFVGGVVESLKNIITMILGVVNMFGDIMSYIRLWAVGLAGAAISSTINTMAGPMLGGFVVFAGVILLLFGHGLNSVMNVLSVLVHGVRLNTLEFSNHLGLTWSGFKYEPFAETVKK